MAKTVANLLKNKLMELCIQRDLYCTVSINLQNSGKSNSFNGNTSCGELPVPTCLISTELQNSAVKLESAVESLKVKFNQQ